MHTTQRDELEGLLQSTLGDVKRRRDDMCEALKRSREASEHFHLPEEITILVDSYEATKQSWADFWGSKKP